MTNYENAKLKAAELIRQNPKMSPAAVVYKVGADYQSQEPRRTKSGKIMMFPAGPASWVAAAVAEALAEMQSA